MYKRQEGALCIEMNGDNMGILIGKRGQTLDSLQYLTNRVANKAQDGYVPVSYTHLDVYKRQVLCCPCDPNLRISIPST